MCLWGRGGVLSLFFYIGRGVYTLKELMAHQTAVGLLDKDLYGC